MIINSLTGNYGLFNDEQQTLPVPDAKNLTINEIQREISDWPAAEPCIFQRPSHLTEAGCHSHHGMRATLEYIKTRRPGISSKCRLPLRFLYIPNGRKRLQEARNSLIENPCLRRCDLILKVQSEVFQASQSDICVLSYTNCASLKSTLGKNKSAIGPDVINYPLEGENPLLRNPPPPGLTLDYPKDIYPSNSHAGRYVDVMLCARTFYGFVHARIKSEPRQERGNFLLIFLPFRRPWQLDTPVGASGGIGGRGSQRSDVVVQKLAVPAMG